MVLFILSSHPLDLLWDTAIHVAPDYKNEAMQVEGDTGASTARPSGIRGMSRYSWGEPRVT